MLKHEEFLHAKARTTRTQTVCFKHKAPSLTEELYFPQITPVLNPSCVFSKITVFIEELK